MRADANPRVILALAQSILETLGSRESIQTNQTELPYLTVSV